MAKYQIDNVASPINFQGSDIIMRTLQNAKNLLMCRLGEVPYDRYRGFDPDVFDLPIDEMQTELLPELDRLMRWEPDVEVEEAEAKLLQDGSTYIKVILNVKIAEAGGKENELGSNESSGRGGAKKISVKESAPIEPVQTSWPNMLSSTNDGAEEDMVSAVKNANGDINKLLYRAKQATETEIYGNAGRVLEVIK